MYTLGTDTSSNIVLVIQQYTLLGISRTKYKQRLEIVAQRARSVCHDSPRGLVSFLCFFKKRTYLFFSLSFMLCFSSLPKLTDITLVKSGQPFYYSMQEQQYAFQSFHTIHGHRLDYKSQVRLYLFFIRTENIQKITINYLTLSVPTNDIISE